MVLCYNSRTVHTAKAQQRSLRGLPLSCKLTLPRPVPALRLETWVPYCGPSSPSRAPSKALATLISPSCFNQYRLMFPLFPQRGSKLKQKGPLPPKYALELLTIYAWEQGSGAQDFDTAEGFRTVLELVTNEQHLCVLWMVNYNFDDEIVRSFLLTQIQRTGCPKPQPPPFLNLIPSNAILVT